MEQCSESTLLISPVAVASLDKEISQRKYNRKQIKLANNNACMNRHESAEGPI